MQLVQNALLINPALTLPRAVPFVGQLTRNHAEQRIARPTRLSNPSARSLPRPICRERADAVAAVEAEMDKANQYVAAGCGIEKNIARAILAAINALPAINLTA